MKHYLASSMKYAIFTLLGIITLPIQADTVTLNTYTPANGSSTASFRDTDLYLDGDWSTVWDAQMGHNFVHWTTSGNGSHSLTGHGTISNAYITTGSYGEDISPSNYTVGSDIALKSGTLKLYNGAYVNYEGSFIDAPNIILCDESRLDLSNATMEETDGLSITMQGNAILQHTNLEFKDNRSLALVSATRAASKQFEGSMTLGNGGRIDFQMSGTDFSALTVTNVLTIEGNAELRFTEDMSFEAHTTALPPEGSILVICNELVGDVSQLTLTQATWDESMQATYAVVDDYTIKSMVYGDGYALYLAAADTPSIPEPTTATLSLLALTGLIARRRRK